VSRARASIERKDVVGLKDVSEALSRTLRMFKGVVAKG
jgi:hypothetical protein